MNRNRTVVINEIISELEKITGDVNIKKIRDELEFASLELEVAAPDESIKLPTDICKKHLLEACNVIKDLVKAIRTRISPITGEFIPNTEKGDNVINNYRTNLHQLIKYLAIVYLLKEDLIERKTFNILVRNLQKNKIGGFNKRRRETRKNKSKRKKPKNKSKREKPKNKSKRKKPKNKSTRKTKQ